MTREQAKEYLRTAARAIFESCNPDNNPARACPNWFELTCGNDYVDDAKLRVSVRELGVDAFPVFHEAWIKLERVWLASTYPTAGVLLELWGRPWSSTALRFANHRLVFLYSHGINVLEADGVAGWIR